jgi:hypothetical protein
VTSRRVPGDLNPRYQITHQQNGLTVESCLWRPQEDLFNFGYLLRATAREGETLPVTIALWDGGTRALHQHETVLQEICATGRAVLVLDTSGVGALLPRSLNSHPVEALYGTLHKLACDLLFLDDDLLSLRTFDVLRALDMVAVWPGLNASEIDLYASGRHGLCGRLAAGLDSRIRNVTVADGPQSWEDWVSARHYETTATTSFCGAHSVILICRTWRRPMPLPRLNFASGPAFYSHRVSLGEPDER